MPEDEELHVEHADTFRLYACMLSLCVFANKLDLCVDICCLQPSGHYLWVF